LGAREIPWRRARRRQGATLVTTDNGVDVLVLADGAGVTWEREGHTCFLSGGGLSDDQRVERASWIGGGTVAF
jgi:hypothetical protein